ncbi:hypothetical protein FS749_005720 [Ceratobasidium sp. UAMH 11750]|nr:hypothetical protein FS749_005720 [Ceratobasidium sp. UAMH 11750]
MKALYHDMWRLEEWIGRRFVRHKHKLIATVDIEGIDHEVNEERKAEGGYRFKSEPLDDKVYRFIFHYADEDTLQDEGFLVPDRVAGKAVGTKSQSTGRARK